VLNLAYNPLLDGVRLEDIELRRKHKAFLDGLGAQRILDPKMLTMKERAAVSLN
jgi:hypothetical protein